MTDLDRDLIKIDRLIERTPVQEFEIRVSLIRLRIIIKSWLMIQRQIERGKL